MAAAFDRLRPGWPNPRVDLLDPIALRAALVLMLAASYAAFGSSSRERLASAFDLRDLSASGNGARIDAWLTPPVYTGKPPLMLIDASQPTSAGRVGDGAIETAERSELTIRINDVHPEAYSLRILNRDGDGERNAAPIRPAAGEAEGGGSPSSSAVEFRETISSVVVAELIRRGETIANWRIRVIPDRPPTIAWVEQLALMQRGSLRVHYKVEDDYGVVSAHAVFERPAAPGRADRRATEPAARQSQVGRRPDLQGSDVPSVGGSSGVPRSDRPRSGWTDRKDRTRHFHASGKAVHQAVGPRHDRTAAHAGGTAGHAGRGGQGAGRADPGARNLRSRRLVYLGLRSAYWRLMDNPNGSADASVIDQLWHVALRIEDGDLSSAERDLRAAQDKLMRALDENASPEEIKRLMDELRTALNHFLESAARNAQNKDELTPHPRPLIRSRRKS